LSDAQVDQLLSQDLVRFESAVSTMVIVELNQNQFDALVSFSFNLGTTALKTSTLLRELNKGNFNEVPTQMMKWVNSDNVVVPGLVNRRQNEIKLWQGQI
jgi:lysozyme